MTLDELVNINYESLNESDLYIWRYISSHREECSKLTIEELGRRCSVSRTTILRFSKKLNLDGFTELKYYLRNEKVAENFVMSKFIDLNTLVKNYTVMLNELKNKDFNTACEMIENAKRIIVVSTGTVQRLIAQELQRSFLRLGVMMTVINGKTEIYRITEWVKEDDLVIMVSLSGESTEIKVLAKELKIKGIATISITRLASNSVSKLVDEAIYVFSDGVPIEGSEVYMSITMFFSTVEILFVRYFNYIQSRRK